MAEISIQADTSKASAFLAALPKQASLDARRALTRATKSAGTLAKRVVSKETGLKARDAAKRIRVKTPTGSSLEGEIRGSLTRIPLIDLGAKGPEPSRGRGRGVSFRGRRGRVRLPHAFIAKIGRRGVRRRVGSERTPTRELFGPSVGRVLERHAEEIATKGAVVFEKEFDRLNERTLARLNA